MTIVISRVLNGFHICFPDVCDITQRDCGLGAGNGNKRITDLLDGSETAQCFQDNFRTVNIDPAGRLDGILLLQGLADDRGIYSELRYFGV